MPQWYINLEDKEEEHGLVTHRSLPPEAAQQWLAELLQRSRANRPPRRGKSQHGIDESEAVLAEN